MTTYTHEVSNRCGDDSERIKFVIATGEILSIELWSDVANMLFDATKDIKDSPFAWAKYQHLVKTVQSDLSSKRMAL